jgi:NTE family protein
VVCEEDEDVSSLRHAERWASGETILLRNDARPSPQGELRQLSENRGATVLRVVPGGPEPLRGERSASTDGEPWASVDWVARHFIKRKVGLALGAGGVKGYAHLGVLEGLRTMGVPIDYVAGTSIGAPLAAAVAKGWELSRMQEQMNELFRDASGWKVPWSSLYSSRGLRRGLTKLGEGDRFEDLMISLAIVAVDLRRRQEVVFREGIVADAMLASAAIPVFWPPVELEGRTLVDGALLNPVPVSAVAEMGADVVISVSLVSPVIEPGSSPRRRRSLRQMLFPRPPLVDTIFHTMEVMQWKITTEGAAAADVNIEPVFVGSTGLLDYSRGDEFMVAGRLATEAAHAELKEWFPWIE